MTVGDRLSLPEGAATVVRIEIEHAEPGTSFTTYNFEVEDCHTYFAGELGVWVHNQGALCARMARFVEKGIEAGSAPTEAMRKLENIISARVANGRISRALGDEHLADALIDLRATYPEEFAGFRLGKPLKGSGASKMLRASLGKHNYPPGVVVEPHHIFGQAKFNTPLGRDLHDWGIDLNGLDNGVWLPRNDYPGRKASLHRGGPKIAYTDKVASRLLEAENRSDALTILDPDQAWLQRL